MASHARIFQFEEQLKVADKFATEAWMEARAEGKTLRCSIAGAPAVYDANKAPWKDVAVQATMLKVTLDNLIRYLEKSMSNKEID